MDELLTDFLGETAEMLAEIGEAIVSWEKTPADRGRLDAIFRFVHTVKGSSGFLVLPRVTALAHAAEDALDQVRRNQRTPDTALVSAVLAIIDRLTELNEAIGFAGAEPAGDDNDVIGALTIAHPSKTMTAQPADIRTLLGDDQHEAALAWRSIRVPLPLLDSVMTGVTDMVLARNEFARLLRDKVRDGAVLAAFDRLSESVAGMRQSVSQMRMQRIDRLFSPLPRIVRDLASELGKQVSFSGTGGEVELDREMIEKIRDPLTHIIRNAIDHGLESPSERIGAGKTAAGRIQVSARQSGNRIDIIIADDGRGIAVDRVVENAVAAGLLSASAAANLSPEDRLELIFTPGLSTAGKVSAISGRGVGMDVVKANIERIGGTVVLDNRPGEGLTIILRVPMTLTIISGLLVSAAGQQFAIPRGAVREILMENSDAVRIETVGGGDFATVRGERLAMVRLETALGLVATGDTDDRSLVLVRPSHDRCYALSVGAVHDHEELVIKPASPAVLATGLYAGTTLPDSGRPVLLLDTVSLPHVMGVDIDIADHAGGRLSDSQDGGEGQRGDQLLLFREADGLVRAMPLAVIERIEEIAAESLFVSAGQMFATINEEILSVFAPSVPIGVARVKLLRLSDGHKVLCYPIASVLDIVRAPDTVRPVATPGLIAATMLVADAPVELIDAYWLMGHIAQAGPSLATERPLCRVIGDSDGWSEKFLAPLLEVAGYRVAFGAAKGSEAVGDIMLSCAPAKPDDAVHGHDGSPPLRLRATVATTGPDDDSIYRYDRAALFEALAARAGGAF